MQAGLDSLGALELRNALQQETGVSLPATFAFDHPSIASMATFFANHARYMSAQPFQDLRGLQEASVQLQPQDLLPQLQAMVQDILGDSVAANRPLMEVSLRFVPMMRSHCSSMRRHTSPLPCCGAAQYQGPCWLHTAVSKDQ